MIEYTESVSLKNLAQKLIHAYPALLSHIDIEKIFFAFKDSENMPLRRNIAEINGVTQASLKKMVSNSGSPHVYCVHIWESDWYEYNESTQEWFMFDLLLAVDIECEGKLNKRDVEEFSPILEFFINHTDIGMNWRDKDGSLPSLLSGDKLSIKPKETFDEDE